jgi:uncharacterized protein (TIGR03382 family)
MSRARTLPLLILVYGVYSSWCGIAAVGALVALSGLSARRHVEVP